MSRHTHGNWTAGCLALVCGLSQLGCAKHFFETPDPQRPDIEVESDAGVGDPLDGVDLVSDGPDVGGEPAAEDPFAAADLPGAGAEQQPAADACAALARHFDFESGEDGFDHAATPGFDGDPWAVGLPSEGGCHSGAACFATNLDGEYEGCTSATLSRALDLSACAGTGRRVQLRFWHYFSFQEQACQSFFGAERCGYTDGGTLQLSRDGGSEWMEADTSLAYSGEIDTDMQSSDSSFWGNSFNSCRERPLIDGVRAWSDEILGRDWAQVTVELDEEHLVSDFALRFLVGSDAIGERFGWSIDDVEIWVE